MADKLNMTVSDLKQILSDLPDDMPIIIPVILEEDCNVILGLRYVRTAGVLYCEDEVDQRTFCLNSANEAHNLSTQIEARNSDIICEKVLF